MRMLHIYSRVIAALMTMSACSAASATMCENLDDTDIRWLKGFYEYAQIAEAPKQNDLMYMEDCVDGNGMPIVERPTGLIELAIPSQFTDLVRNRADNDRARLQPTRRTGNGGNSPFTVGCRAEGGNQDMLIEFGFKLLARIVGDWAFFWKLYGKLANGPIF